MSIDLDSSRRPIDGSVLQGAEAQAQIRDRQRRGQIWLGVFLLAVMISVLALGALLYSIINSAIGLVAVQRAITPEAIVQRVAEEKMLAMPNTVASEDDEALAAGVANDPYAIGFFGYAFYKENATALKPLAINSIAPTAATVEDNTYPLSRPLFVYVPADVLTGKPEVAGYIDYYLKNVNQVIDNVGYFPLPNEVITRSINLVQSVVPPQKGLEGGYPQEGNIQITGSSTLAPLTLRMADLYRQAGYQGVISVDSTGTRAGFRTLCVDGAADVADASRALNPDEAQVCTSAGRDLLEFPVGLDAIAVVVNPANTFLASATDEELRKIFTQAEKWSDVNPQWPDAPIKRFIPAGTSGTLDYFVEKAFSGIGLADLPATDLIAVLSANVSKGVIKRFEREKPLDLRTPDELVALVVERVVQPKIVDSWNLTASLFGRNAIEQAAFAQYPDANLEWRSWINLNFLTSPQSSNPDVAGVRTAILGTLWVVLITVVFAVPVGLGASIYLEEYAGQSRMNRIIQTNIDNLAGVPSIIYGILGLAVFVRALEPLTSGSFLGVVDPTTANGRTVLAAGLTMGLLVLPIVIINSQEAIRAVPKSLREAGYGVGGTKWQVVRSHVIANALPGIFTGIILAVSRAIGETAPLVVIGASTFIVTDPTDAFSKFTALPMQIYQWTARPQAEFRHIAAAASIVLLVMLFMMNFTAIYLRNRYSKRY